MRHATDFRWVHPGGITIEQLPNAVPRKWDFLRARPDGITIEQASGARNSRSIVASIGASPMEARAMVIPIPLKPGDADASVSLQEVFDIVYQRARYDLSVRYDAPLDPPLSPDELRWVQSPSSQS